MSGRGGKDQRSEALLVPVLNVSASAQQQVHQLLVAPGTGQGQSSVVIAVSLAVKIHRVTSSCLARLTGLLLLLLLTLLTCLASRGGVSRSLGGLGVSISIVASVTSIVKEPGSGLNPCSKLGTHTRPGGRGIDLTFLLARLLLVRL